MSGLLTKIIKLLELIVQRQMNKWSESPGQNTEVEYYTGVETGNPSGTTSNIKYIKYLDKKGDVVFRKELSYDASDLIILVEPKSL